jgi:hypothetical protein
MLQCLGAQLPVQDMGRCMQQQAQAIGEKACAGGAVGRQIILEMLDVVFGLTARGVNRSAVMVRNSLTQMFAWAEKRQPWRKLPAPRLM